MSNVKIALRVRPLSERERNDETSSTSIVKVEDEKTASVTNLKVAPHHAGDSRERIKRFAFDYCFDSSTPGSCNHATQEVVFSSLGKIVLESFARGQDACVLAYGQSASGKTHTMQGADHDPGLAPRLCDALFETSSEENGKLSMSFFEIYNERVRDLLTDVQPNTLENEKESSCSEGYSANHFKCLRVREHPMNGPYVEGLQEIIIERKEHIVTLLKTGSSRRKTAATQRNPESSRSHAVLVLKKVGSATTLTLLDLAGSERPSRVNQSISHQKEGSNINKSLVALSNVISALAEASPRTNRYVPYRDSVLTWLLKDTLSGGTTTIMVATVSPSSSCYAETVNTMRWASRAGRIQATSNAGNRPPKTASQKSLRALRAEVSRLRELLLNVTKDKIKKEPVELVHQTTQVSFKREDGQVRQEEIQDNDVTECTIKEENSLDDNDQEEDDSLNSLGSSRLSVISNDTLSNPSTHGSNLHSGPTEDILFGPRLNRTNSVHELKPLPPLRNENRQYSSHEGLANIERKLPKTPLVRLNKNVISRLGDKEKVDNFNSTDHRRIDPYDNNTYSKTHPESQRQHVPYEPFNKRAVIVASVTDRLYAYSKKKEEEKDKMGGSNRAESKTNGTKKKLYDISYRALRASRRFRVGVPAETQTERGQSLRVKEIGTDIQHDIEPLPFTYDETGKKFSNASVETESTTLLCKEASVETLNNSIHSDDKSVETEKHTGFGNLVFTKTCGNMTEANCTYTTSTQTCEVPPPRKKYSSFTKYLKVKQETSVPETSNERLSPKVFNISISHDCNQLENEGDSISDDSLEYDIKLPCSKLQSHATPDLLNNHSSTENVANRNDDCSEAATKPHTENSSQTIYEDFNTGSCCTLNGNCIQHQNNSKATNSECLIKSKTGVDIGGRCDRVTAVGGEVIKEHIVTGNGLQASLICNADTAIKLNNNVCSGERDDKVIRENYHSCTSTSKATQFDGHNSEDNIILADFLEDIYVPLPRICVTSDFSTERWPSIRNIILGRQDENYPYNITISPKRDETSLRKRSKSVTWKIDKDSPKRSNIIKSALKRPYGSFKSGNCSQHYRTTPAVASHCDYREKDRQIDDFTYRDHKKCVAKNTNFRGISTWEDRMQDLNKPVFNRIKNPDDENIREYETRYGATCVHYMNVTSDLIKETTNLVACSEQPIYANDDISPVCNQPLQTVDENMNKPNLEVHCQPSTSTHYGKYEKNRDKPKNDPLGINDELIYDEDDFDLFDTNGNVELSSDEELNNLSKNVDDLERQLNVSLDRLNGCTEKSREYFEKLPYRYSECFDRKLPSECGPIPFPRTRRNPSKYLEELLQIRKDLVECTKRDENICKEFQRECYI